MLWKRKLVSTMVVSNIYVQLQKASLPVFEIDDLPTKNGFTIWVD